MQVIKTYFLPCTDTKGSQIKAKAEAGSVTLCWRHEMDRAENHERALKALCRKGS